MTKKPDEWMALHVRRYLGDTTNLTRDQHGGYLLMIMTYWLNGGPLPDDDGELAAICKATPNEWRKKLKPILSRYFTIKDGLWHNKRCDEELAKARKLVAAKSSAGKKGAAAKWKTDSEPDGTDMADASPSHRLDDDGTDDKPMDLLPTTTNQRPQEEKLFTLNSNGLVGKRTTIDDPHERLERFKTKLLRVLGGGASAHIIDAACDPDNPQFELCLSTCKKAAEKLGKGWPTNWPTQSGSVLRFDINGEAVIPGGLVRSRSAA